MDQKTFWQYQKQVWSRATRRVTDKFGVVGAAVGFSASLIAVYFIRETQTRTDVNAGDVVITAEIFLGLCVVAIAIYAFREPVIIHNEQVGEIKTRDQEIAKLKDRWEGTPVRVDLGVSVFEDFDTAPNRKVGISIRNPVPQKITDVTLTLSKLIWTREDDPEYDYLPTIAKRNRGFDTDALGKPPTIQGLDTVVVDLAEVDMRVLDHWFVFLLEPRHRIHPLDTLPNMDVAVDIADFEIEVTISGSVDDRKIQDVPFKAHLHFQKGRGLPGSYTFVGLRK